MTTETPEELTDDQKVIAYINETPTLMSLLYDLDLLPEQHPDRESEAWWKIFNIANHWREHDIALRAHLTQANGGDEWISVEDKFPPYMVSVILTDGRSVGPGYYTGDGEFSSMTHVKYWMEYPPAPQPKPSGSGEGK